MTIDRTIGVNALKTVLKSEKNINILENAIHDQCENDDEYKEILFEIINDINNKQTLQNVLTKIKSDRTKWNNDCFNSVKESIFEQDEFIENPFEIEEGVIQCNCGSRRVFSYSKQVRSLDEGCNLFAQCIACGAKWQNKG